MSTEVTCCRCGAVKEPELIEGKRRSLPMGWLQVQVINHIGFVQNGVLCAVDAALIRRAMIREPFQSGNVA